MEIKEVVEAWKKEELSGDAAMFVIHDILHPGKITKKDIEWGKRERKSRKSRQSSWKINECECCRKLKKCQKSRKLKYRPLLCWTCIRMYSLHGGLLFQNTWK